MIKDTSLKKTHLFMVERYPLYSYCHGTADLWYLFETRCPVTPERGEMPIAYCSVKEGSLQFDQLLRPFYSYFATIIELA